MEKIAKKKTKNKNKNTTKKNDQIDILRLKQSFFPRLRAVPYLFLKFGPCPHKFGNF